MLINLDQKHGLFATYEFIVSVYIMRAIWRKKNYVHAVTGPHEYSHCEWMTR